MKKIKRTVIGALLLIAIWLFFISQDGRAETIVEVAPAIAYSGDVEKGQFALMGHERFNDKYEVGVILLIDTSGNDNGNRGIEALRVAEYRGWEAGIGFSLWSNVQSQAWNTDQTFTLLIGYEWDRFGIRWRHWSTGGTSSKNSGMDMLTFGWRFGVD